MISIIVPTMWRYTPFTNFVSYIARLDVVKDVVIINNDHTRTPDHAVLLNPKVKLLDFGKNIFVNPAFNVGVHSSAGDIMCFLNDDMLFDLKLLFKIDEFMTPDHGAVGLCKGIAKLGQTPITDGQIQFEPFTNQNCHGFGEIMFAPRKNWVDIPVGLDLGFGDNFIFERYYFGGFRNFFIANMLHHHEGSLTVNEMPQLEKQAIYEREKLVYAGVREEMVSGKFFKASNSC
jgi:hypothetical protein